MVKNLIPLNIEDFGYNSYRDYVQALVDERKRNPSKLLFQTFREEWKNRVEQYINSGGSPLTVKCWPAATPAKGTFINLYSHPKEGSVQLPVLDELKKIRRKLNLCPCCGELGTPDTLDHYLPKDDYPHFSVIPANLVPMCTICQRAKGTKVGNGQNPRFFLHPYFDIFLSKELVHLKVTPPFEQPSFILEPNQNLQHQEIEIVSTHFNELNIHNRYNEFLESSYIKLLRYADMIRKKNGDVKSRIEECRDLAKMEGVNSWDNILYSSALRDKNLLKYLETGQLPNHL